MLDMRMKYAFDTNGELIYNLTFIIITFSPLSAPLGADVSHRRGNHLLWFTDSTNGPSSL